MHWLLDNVPKPLWDNRRTITFSCIVGHTYVLCPRIVDANGYDDFRPVSVTCSNRNT